ncbi:ribonuclease Y [Candidatus Berkelbacteria bacterium CG10_big_fil_rev_8_21_14_0_10_41_12]|uniref:Ribonuclease Y n=1 Tax=Candidatus Berkelbacteria bacterium CG10_big_fil_rev_8_21_14_0_10_41_12 TaxID=1974513 RepID=A0A2M6WXD4_9BACT|nr:MAG: ribonuclease Y [Candidatus Berkelbacteria bacterium CG10_big_fil_rev_8_21_14_0_10_41_12]
MSLALTIILIAAGVVVGATAGFLVRQQTLGKRLKESENKSKELILEAKNEALKIKETTEKERDKALSEIKEVENTLQKREASLDERISSFEMEKKNIEKQEADIERIKSELKDIERRQLTELEKVAKLKKEDARNELIKSIEKEYQDEIILKIRELKAVLKENSEAEAQKIIATSIQRIANEYTTEHTTMSVHIPNDEMKGRIIGKEGRNIQAFERATGVDLIIDETPDTVLLSSFNPVRRYIAKVALEKLIADGRIQPSRIEEVFAKVQTEVKKEAKEAGEHAALDNGVRGLHPDLMKILGNLKYRVSYGQNILAHSVEVANIGAILAAEVGADVNIVKKAGLLHDIGKAVSQEVTGAHHHISGEIAKKYGISDDVVHAIMAHHDDVEPKTVEAVIVKAADAISGARPGARRETLENYTQRLKDLENVANSFEGVDKSFAIQAGREIRIIVRPEQITDLEAIKLSKDIARKIERDLQYPGMIKVNVIRETRSEEYAR